MGSGESHRIHLSVVTGCEREFTIALLLVHYIVSNGDLSIQV